ncbi:transposase [Mycobacterium sp. 5-140-3-2]|uniref:transposase n=1 Tax=unclassified Mycobacterium TaxID=2642494 RepID=UPI002D7995F5|nr:MULTISPECIES: transposase [unclassified Mycobacterium]WRU83596.1 transposase [Mycobacterium sp. 5-140-3-2]WSE40258.1 transposase [Mycobacterium sp. 5-140-3-1]
MPELLEEPGSAGAVVVVVEGAYAVLARREAQHRTEVDPRLLLADPNGFYQQKQAAVAASEFVEMELLAAARPLAAPAWVFGGNSLPLPAPLRPMFRGGGRVADEFEVRPDDSVRPTGGFEK